MKKEDVVILSDEYAAQKTLYGIHVFPYFEDGGEIHEDLHAGSVMLKDHAIAALAEKFLKLPAMLDETIGLFLEFQRQHGYDEDGARTAAVLEILEGLKALEDIAELEREQKRNINES